MTLRLVEPPLGADAFERPTREEMAQLWAEARRQPVPDYPRRVLERLFPGRARRP